MPNTSLEEAAFLCDGEQKVVCLSCSSLCRSLTLPLEGSMVSNPVLGALFDLITQGELASSQTESIHINKADSSSMFHRDCADIGHGRSVGLPGACSLFDDVCHM